MCVCIFFLFVILWGNYCSFCYLLWGNLYLNFAVVLLLVAGIFHGVVGCGRVVFVVVCCCCFLLVVGGDIVVVFVCLFLLLFFVLVVVVVVGGGGGGVK